MTRTLGLVTTLTMLAGSPGVAQPVISELDRFYREVAARAAPYAFSVVLVSGDSIAHVGGYGSRDGNPARVVTGTTPFYIASSTKSFTALTAVLLAGRGVIDLDAPISKYLPEFALPAPLDPSRVTLRRLLSHRAGFESGPVAFRTAYVGDVPPDSIIPIVSRTAQPVDSAFTYTNTAFIVAARVLEQVTNTPWQDLLVREVGRPLGLTRMTARPSAARRWDPADGITPGPTGYRWSPGKPDATMHAAGGLLLSAADAGRWLRVQLNHGRLAGRQVFPAAAITETHKLLATQRDSSDGIYRVSYGLGWQVGLVEGDTLYHHFGNYPGSFAHVSFMPARDVGVAVFTNSEMPGFGRAAMVLARRAYDHALRRHARDAMYGSYADTLNAAATRMFEVFRTDFERRSARAKAPPRGWAAYAGSYVAPNMGRLSIVALDDTSAELRYGVARSRLEVLRGDTLRVEMPPGRGGTVAPVTIGPDGRVATITISGTSFVRSGGQ